VKAATLLKLAWRESRFARRRLFLFLSSISLGIAALVAVQGFASNTAQGVRGESLALLGADFVLSAREPFGPVAEQLLDSLGREGVPVSRVTSFNSMALHTASGSTRLVQVRAPEPGFPFYGQIRTTPDDAWSDLQRGRHILVDQALLVSLGAAVGDSLGIGQQTFLITGVLESVPGDTEIASAFAPRVFIPAAQVAATGLVGFGSRVEYEAYVRYPGADRVRSLLERYRSALRAERVGSRSADEQQQMLEQALGRLTSFLGLIGVLALLLGGIGVASAMGAYMTQKRDTVSVLRCLGATSRQLMGVYLIQAAAMGLAGAVLGVVIGSAVQWVLPRLLAGLLPVEVEVGLDFTAVLVGLGVGLWTAVVFALLPLLRIRHVSPLGALRRNVEPLETKGVDAGRVMAWVALALSLLLLLLFQVRELRLATALFGGIVLTLAVLWGAAVAVTRLVRRLRYPGMRYPLRQGLSNLHRPGNQTRTVVLSLGFGVFLLATLLLLQHNLLLPLRTGDSESRANLFLWDVQEDQLAGVENLLDAGGAPVLQRAPIIPMRIAAIRGEPVRPAERSDTLSRVGDQPRGWAARREYRSTFRDTLVRSERLVEGSFPRPDEAAPDGAALISMEKDIAADLGLRLGDRVDWDIQGVIVPSVLSSIREVDWARFEPNFFVVFPTEALEPAPRTWVMLTRAETPAERARLTASLVSSYPNIAALDLTQVQEALDQVVGRVVAVIRFLAAFSVATGFVVLLGAISTSRLQRIRESVLLKTLGATRRQIASILFLEYLLLGTLAGIVGTVLAVGGGWAVATGVFDLDFEVTYLSLMAVAVSVALLSALVGIGASREVFRRTPMEALRDG
jgi:putative ABC transport system permease protein